jgi:hypothetical protein
MCFAGQAFLQIPRRNIPLWIQLSDALIQEEIYLSHYFVNETIMSINKNNIVQHRPHIFVIFSGLLGEEGFNSIS